MPCFCFLVVDEQNAHTDEQDLQSPTDIRKDTEEENKDDEKDEDTKELESLPCEFKTALTQQACKISRFNSCMIT